eukprot:scaffold10975_cov105-Isochrysis_galbana.AAC.2
MLPLSSPGQQLLLPMRWATASPEWRMARRYCRIWRSRARLVFVCSMRVPRACPWPPRMASRRADADAVTILHALPDVSLTRATVPARLVLCVVPIIYEYNANANNRATADLYLPPTRPGPAAPPPGHASFLAPLPLPYPHLAVDPLVGVGHK